MAAQVGWLQRRRLLNTATIWLALSVSSCALFGPEEPATPPPIAEPPPPAPVAEISPPAPPRPARKPAPPPAQQPTDQQPTDQRPTDLPSAAESEPVDPEHIIGLDERDAENWLGMPSERSDAPPGTIWRYFTKSCQVDVYFYLDLQKGVMRALTYEVRSDDIVDRRPERCFQQLVVEHRQRESHAASIGTH